MKMLTPKDLRNHQFQMSGRNGYLAADVDDYMDEVYNSYDQMFRENAEIVRKLQVLADRLAKYKDDEENIRNALVEAQRMKNSIIVEAQQKAQGQLSETEEKIRAAQENLLKREERRQAKPVSSGAANSSDVGWSGRPAQYGDWRDSIVPLPENAARVRFDRDTPPPVEVPAATQAASLETTGTGVNEQALVQRLADIMGAGRRKAKDAEAAEAKPKAKKVAPPKAKK